MSDPITTPGYRYAVQRIDGDGVTRVYNFNFAGPAPGYLDPSHVKLFKYTDASRVEVPFFDFTLIGANQVELTTAPTTSEVLVIRRSTPKDLPMVDFVEGAILNEVNLDTTTRQAIYAAAEMVDYFADLLDAFNGVNQDVINALNFALEALARANAAFNLAAEAKAEAAEALAKAIEALARSIEAQEDAEEALALATQAAIDAANALEIAENIDNGTSIIVANSRNIEIAANIVGRMQNDSEEIVRYVTTRPFRLNATTGSGDFSAGRCAIRLAPVSNFILNLSKNGVTFGTATILAGQVTGVVAITTQTSFAGGDILQVSTTTGDANARDFSITLNGIRL